MTNMEIEPKGWVKLHLKRPTERNPSIAVVTMDWGEWSGAWVRPLKHKGIDPYSEIRRRMTTEEYQRESKYNRMHWYSYSKWEALIKDEWANTQNTEWCNEIIEVARINKTLDQILTNKPT